MSAIQILWSPSNDTWATKSTSTVNYIDNEANIRALPVPRGLITNNLLYSHDNASFSDRTKQYPVLLELHTQLWIYECCWSNQKESAVWRAKKEEQDQTQTTVPSNIQCPNPAIDRQIPSTDMEGCHLAYWYNYCTRI